MSIMNKSLIVIGAAAFVATSQVSAQDISEGTVLAFDRKANILVFTDKTVWPLEKLKEPLSVDLKAGDRVEIQYDSNEDDGITEIYEIKVQAQ